MKLDPRLAEVVVQTIINGKPQRKLWIIPIDHLDVLLDWLVWAEKQGKLEERRKKKKGQV